MKRKRAFLSCDLFCPKSIKACCFQSCLWNADFSPVFISNLQWPFQIIRWLFCRWLHSARCIHLLKQRLNSVQHLSRSSISEEKKELRIPAVLNDLCWAGSYKLSGKTLLWNIWVLSTRSSVSTDACDSTHYSRQNYVAFHSRFLQGDSSLFLLLGRSLLWLCWLPSNKSRENWLSPIHPALEVKNVFLKHLNYVPFLRPASSQGRNDKGSLRFELGHINLCWKWMVWEHAAVH